jgi:CrcB protein
VSFSLALLVALLGAVGSVLRWAAQQTIQGAVGHPFPAGTLFVNVLGSFVIGAVMALYGVRGELESHTRIALTAGLLGGFTTYSSFAWDTLALVEKRSYGLASLYVGTTVATCFAACWAGAQVVRMAVK